MPFVNNSLITIDGREPSNTIDFAFSYNAGATTTILYPRLIIGTGSDATINSQLTNGLIPGDVPMRLKRIVLNCATAGGATAITLQSAINYTTYSLLATANVTLGAQRNTIEFLQVAGNHTILAGNMIGIGIDPTNALGYVSGLLQFERA